jgi:hypothetical protein
MIECWNAMVDRHLFFSRMLNDGGPLLSRKGGRQRRIICDQNTEMSRALWTLCCHLSTKKTVSCREHLQPLETMKRQLGSWRKILKSLFAPVWNMGSTSAGEIWRGWSLPKPTSTGHRLCERPSLRRLPSTASLSPSRLTPFLFLLSSLFFLFLSLLFL